MCNPIHPIPLLRLFLLDSRGIGGSKASSLSRPARECSCRRVWQSCGEGVVRASAVSVTERVLFFNHVPRAFHYQCSSSKTFFVIDRVARKSCDGRRYLRSMYTV